MKTKLILLSLFATLAADVATAQTLVLHHANGRTTEVELYKKPVVTFDGDKVLVTSPVLNMEYAKDDVLRFTYKNIPLAATPVSRPKSAPTFSQTDDQLTFRGVTATDAVAVYTIDGKHLPVALRRIDDAVVLPLSAIPSGVYLLSVNGKTTKFTKP